LLITKQNPIRAAPATNFRYFSDRLLALLRHKFSCCERLPIGAAQHGHRESVPASATTNRLRIVAMEFGT
jgi:hypothetical protein